MTPRANIMAISTGMANRRTHPVADRLISDNTTVAPASTRKLIVSSIRIGTPLRTMRLLLQAPMVRARAVPAKMPAYIVGVSPYWPMITTGDPAT